MAAILTASSGPSYAPEDPTLPKPWKGLVDGTTGYIYFWNPETNDTQYERPVHSSNGVSALAQKSAVFVSSSVQKPSQGQHYDPDGRHSRGSNNKVTSLKGDQNARSSSDHHEGYDSLGVGTDISQESYCRHNEISVTGGDVPAPLTSFEATGFPSEIVREMRQAGFSAPTPIQAQSWPVALQGRDIVAIAKTGSGKTLGYLIPGFIHLKNRRSNPQLGPTILVLSPTRELATQIQAEAVKFGKSSRISCTCLYGGAPKGPQLRELSRGVDIVVATPGRLNDILEMRRLSLGQVSYLVLDEADRMLDMGFEPQIRKIVKEVPKQRQTLMYTATWPKGVRKIAADLLVNSVQVNIGNVDELAANKSITQHIEVLSSMEKQRRLEQILRSNEPGSKIIIFCSTKKMCDQLSRNLTRNFGAAAIHGDKSQGERDYVLSQFRTGRSPVLVATDVAARGLDIKDIRVVVNFDFPTGIEDYVHRIGRTGRAGASGLAYTFFSDQDAKHALDLVKVLEGANQSVPTELRDMVSRGGGMGKARWGSGQGGRGGRFNGSYVSRNGGRGDWNNSSSERGGGRGYDRGSRDSDRFLRGDASRKRSRSRSPNKGSVFSFHFSSNYLHLTPKMTMMSNEEEKRCPLCAEEMDWTDQQFKPCKCGYQVCVWCWHHIMDIAEKDVSEGRCPACRTKYEKDKVVAMQANFERAGNTNVNRKSKPPKAKTKANEVRKDLTNVRVIQRKMAYVTGLPLGIADEDLLQRKEYFGQYGKISKVSLSRTAGGSIQLFTNDTFSVYITYSKEEEAIQCIQSVHGFVLEGMYLRASFGTAKYCHAWLRNTPCNNLSCLYLHSLGADEDSFGKDEVAAIHTRSRVQQIVGASSSAMKRSGNILPPPINILSCTSFTSTESSTIQSAGAASDIVNHNSYMARVIPCSDKYEDAGDPNRMSAFVDVGLCNSSGAEKVRNCSGDSRTLDLCSNLSPETINKDNLAQEPYSDTLLFEVPSSNHLVNHLPRDQNSIEISDEPFREDSISIDSRRLKDLNSINQRAFLMSSHSAKCTGDSGGHSLMHRRTCSLSNNGTEHRSLHNEVEEASPPLSCVNSTMIDGLHDLKFQSSVKSDTIYRGSNSFSNEEIVEHLRRTRNDCLNNYDKSSAFSPAKNSMNLNILAMNLGSRDDSLTLRHSITGLCNEPNGQHDSWKFLHSGQGFSFMKQDGSSGQRADLNSSSSNISLISKQASILDDFRENKEQHMLDSQYQISRPKGMAPPGFSISSRELPPGFPLSDEIGGFPRTLSGSQLVNSSSSLIHYPSSMRSFSSAGDTDFIDPAILSSGKGKTTNGLCISGLEIGSQGRALEAEARLWLLMQRKHADQDGKSSHVHASQTPSAYQDQRFNGEDEHTGTKKFGPRLVDQGQNFDQSLYTHFPPQKFGNGPISNGFQHDLLGNFQCRNEVDGMAELQRNERLGFNKYYNGYGNQTVQGSGSGDVFARVFGM